MIQELFGGSAANFISGSGSDQRKFSINGGAVLLPPTLPSLPSSSSTPSSTAAAAAAAAPPNAESQQNLRCPRCDSSNTKFCYYNNYNLTQPRHFCKTCRRYWTKGGALRNVPIGGGCRKNRSSGASSSVAKASTNSAATKMKAIASELGRPTPGLGPASEITSTSPILWGSPQSTHLLSLLRASHGHNQNSNPNPNPSSMTSMNSTSIKEEGNLMRSQSYMLNEALNHRGLGYDGVGGQVLPSLGLCSSLWRNNTTGGGFVLGEHQGSGIQELYNKLRSSSSSSGNTYYSGNNSPMFLGNVASSSSSSSLSNILESSSVATTELGSWNSNIPTTLPWAGLPTTNGAYP